MMRTNRSLFFLWLGGFLFAVPFILAFFAGLAYLWISDLFLWWVVLAAVSYVMAWWIWGRLKLSSSSATDSTLDDRLGPEKFWSPFDLEVWDRIKTTADRVNDGSRKVEDLNEVRALAEELLAEVAGAYHPNSNDPRLEVKLSHVLLVTEQASSDLRELFVENLPLHNVMTLNDLLTTRKTFNLLGRLYDYYRVIRPFANPAAAIVNELKGLIAGRSMQAVSRNTANWVMARFVEGAGRHLINLYSGQVFDPTDLPLREKDEDFALQSLKILLIGPVNAGKSSLINALFGEVRTAAYHLPETREVIAFSKELPKVGKVILLDTAGFNETSGRAPLKDALKLIHQVDLIVLVTPANSAARQLEFDFVTALDALKESNTREIFPPLVVALNKIDLLKPVQEWTPPYNVDRPDSHRSDEKRRKADNIRECILAVSSDLRIPPEMVIPLALKDPANPYNLDSLVLILGQVLPYARHTLLRRMLREHRDDKYWEDLKGSLVQSGKLVVKTGLDSVLKGLRNFSKTVDRFSKE
jgi:uncharacterized protein